jgi:hypothetical protein
VRSSRFRTCRRPPLGRNASTGCMHDIDEFLGLVYVKPATLGNTRMQLSI